MDQVLDQEWLELLMMAKELGLTTEEIRDFLQSSSVFISGEQKMAI